MSDSQNNPLDGASTDDAWLNLANDEPEYGVPPCVKRVIICGDEIHIRTELESDPAVRINVTDPRTLMQLVAALEQANVRRLFYRPGGTAVDQSLCNSLQEKGIAAVPISESKPADEPNTENSPDAVSAEDFMDDADAEIVAQRLRELGYL